MPRYVDLDSSSSRGLEYGFRVRGFYSELKVLRRNGIQVIRLSRNGWSSCRLDTGHYKKGHVTFEEYWFELQKRHASELPFWFCSNQY